MYSVSGHSGHDGVDSWSEHVDYPRHASPPPPDEQAHRVRDERRYRMLLQHEFHPSPPYWTPTQVLLGAVGYHNKATGGEFVTLFNSFQPANRRYTSQLRAGHRTAHLFTESTVYRYIEELATPKKWFKANADGILALYGKEPRISKEDLYLVIGTLEAQEYALCVSHEHPDGQLALNVFSAKRTVGRVLVLV
ncbi:hypothetical protein C8Q76DRAFT_693720 [Earliella scabrosa]|nr:hypothetical protein C8Q76DRAFT_693720 [Earliella scabrosa]